MVSASATRSTRAMRAGRGGGTGSSVGWAATESGGLRIREGGVEQRLAGPHGEPVEDRAGGVVGRDARDRVEVGAGDDAAQVVPAVLVEIEVDVLEADA